ncbi:hypothetical protein [Vulcanisaeta distributa]|uniref:hypothetical protein n=1 Tax=Vulcanisaeta distributa TaxID=164451 RepID=UPI0006D045D4|nr:hypothetical protein [Vulcanisaeta distributa]
MPSPYLYVVVVLVVVLVVVGVYLGMLVGNEASRVSALQGEVNSLRTNYTVLQVEYGQLKSQYVVLQANYSALQSQYNQLEVNYTSLRGGEYEELRGGFVDSLLGGQLVLWSSVPGYPRLVSGRLQVTPNEPNTMGIIAIPIRVYRGLVNLTIDGLNDEVVGNDTAILVVLAPYGSLTLINQSISLGNQSIQVLMPSNVTYYAVYHVFLSNLISGGVSWNSISCSVVTSSSYYPIVLVIKSPPTTAPTLGMGCGTGYATGSEILLGNGIYWLVIEFINGPGSYIGDNYIVSINYETGGWSMTLTPMGIISG